MTDPTKLAIYYRDDMVRADDAGNYSKSPTKPRRFLEFLQASILAPHLIIRADFEPLTRADLLTAHEAGYVDAFLSGTGSLTSSNGLEWSAQFRDSVLLTNSCLLRAIVAALDDPQQTTMAPVSGFHHATPQRGGGFCTFSGQVIAALQVYRGRGKVGAWIDLDGHFGNSIEDSRNFAADLDLAIPRDCNVNPSGSHADYLGDLQRKLAVIERLVRTDKVHYLCFAHGADSHQWDQLGHQCSTEEWLQASDAVYEMVAKLRADGHAVPVTLALFGGYRDDHPQSVLGLHAMDTARALAWLCGHAELRDYQAEVRAPKR